MNYDWDFGIILRYSHLLTAGLKYTLFYTTATILIGTLIGILFAAAVMTSKISRIPVTFVIEIFRCTPALVLIVWFYYALPVVIGIEMSAPVAAILMLSMYTAAFFSEIFRGGIESVPRGQWEAARSLGLKSHLILYKVIFPQAIKVMIPPYMNQAILQLKNTSLVSVIAVPDLLYQGNVITSDTFRPLEVYTTVAIIYFAILFPLTRFARYYESSIARRLSR